MNIPQEIQELEDKELLEEHRYTAVHLYICEEQGQIDTKEENIF